MLKPKYNNDLPTVVDNSLGTEKLIKKLAFEINNSLPPKTFSITGYWGSGKTSALAMLFKELTKNPPPFISNDEDILESDCIGIWFEAWRYQHESIPIVALLQTIKKSFSVSDKFINKAGKLTSVAFLGALTVLDGVIKSATGLSGLSKIKGIGESYEKENLLSRLSSDHINDALKKAIDTLIGVESNNSKKLIIFIDDLDRCEPEAALNLLEGLKLFLSIPNCVVVMAIDSHQIESNLLKKLGDETIKNNRFYGVEYMEKLCQDAYRLPVPDIIQRTNFVNNSITPLLSDLKIDRKVVVKDLFKILSEYDCLPANPRRLKMLCNRIASIFRYVIPSDVDVLQTHSKAETLTENQTDELFALGVLIVASLSVNYRRIYERLEQNSAFIAEIFTFCDSVDEKKYDDPQSVFYEFHQITSDSSSLVAHASDLGVFRLRCLFLDSAGSTIEKFSLSKILFGDFLHQIIKQYNQKD